MKELILFGSHWISVSFMGCTAPTSFRFCREYTRSQLNLNTISEFDIASFQTDILTRTAQPTHAVARILFCKNAVPNYYSYLFWLVNIKKDNNLRTFSRCNLKVGISIVVLPPRECIWIFCCCWYSKWLWKDYSTMTIHNNTAFC